MSRLPKKKEKPKTKGGTTNKSSTKRGEEQEALELLEIIDFSKELTEEQRKLIEPFADCGKCRKKNKINIITDCPKIEEEVEEMVAEGREKEAWKNERTRYCLAKKSIENMRQVK